MHPQDPSTDQAIAQRYGVKTIEKKVENKTDLQKQLGWPEETKRMMICLPCGMTRALGGDLLIELIPGLMSLPIEFIIRGKGEKEYGELFSKLARDRSHRFAIVPDREESVRAMLAASDCALFLSCPPPQRELKTCLWYGTVPITPECAMVENYDPIQEKGTAFTFASPTIWEAYSSIVRAIETHKFPFDWRTIQKQCMESIQ